MTLTKSILKLRCAFGRQHAGSTGRCSHVFSIGLALMLALAAQTGVAQVKLENTIKKVQTFVNDAGEVQRRMVDADSVVPGDELQYTIAFTNHGQHAVDAGTIVITDAIPSHTEYLDGTAYGAGTNIEYSIDGEIYAVAQELKVLKDGAEVYAAAAEYTGVRWNFSPALEPGASGYVSFNVRLK